MLTREEALKAEPDLSPNLSVIVAAFDGEEMVGHLPIVMTPHLSGPSVRRTHVGAVLEKAAVKVVREVMGFSHLMSLTPNQALVRGMRKLGWKPTGEIVLEKRFPEGESFRRKGND